VESPKGGYLLAILGRAAARTADHHHVLAASAHYLRSPDPGTATIAAEVLRAGSIRLAGSGLDGPGRPALRRGAHHRLEPAF
jgi:hypothetical protein